MKHLFPLLVCGGLLTCYGCSQKSNYAIDTISEAIFGFEDVTLTKEAAEKIPYASLYVRINNGSRLLMVLAYAEHSQISNHLQLQWTSADHALMVTEGGRIIKTLNLPTNNLSQLQACQATKCHPKWLPAVETQPTWSARYDWQDNYQYNQDAVVTQRTLGTAFITSLLWAAPTKVIAEDIRMRDGQEFTNTYWKDEKGRIVKSDQWLIPQQLHIEYEVIRFYDAQ